MVPDISLISDKTMLRYSRESVKKNHDKKMKNYLIPFLKQNTCSLNRSGVNP